MKTPDKVKEPLPFDEPEAPLEKALIDEYLQRKGFASIKALIDLPEDEAKQIMIEACRYASLKLAEIESRTTFKKEIHYEDK